jgi:alcohol dehydrogenase YqhD (iron-dependent ADH family)
MEGGIMKQFVNSYLKMYTEIVFGKDSEKQVGGLVKSYGGTRALLVYGGGSIKASGLFDSVAASLAAAGVSFIELGGVQPNPRKSLVIKGIELAKGDGVDFVLAVGGGSVIDTAKAIAIGLADDGVWDHFAKRSCPNGMLKVGAVNTISAAGSETSGSVVIVDDIDTKRKISLMYPSVIRPVFAVMNPELTYSVSPYQTAVGAADIFAHSFERFFNKYSSNLADELGAAVMRNVIKYAKTAIENPKDYEARAELMLAGSYAHNEITSIGRVNTPFTAHSLEVYLSGKYDTAHGAGISILIPAYLERIVYEGSDEQVARAAQLAVSVFGSYPEMGDMRATALDGIRRYKQWNKDIGLPSTLAELGIPKGDLDELVMNCRCDEHGIVQGFMDMGRDTLKRLYESVI